MTGEIITTSVPCLRCGGVDVTWELVGDEKLHPCRTCCNCNHKMTYDTWRLLTSVREIEIEKKYDVEKSRRTIGKP